MKILGSLEKKTMRGTSEWLFFLSGSNYFAQSNTGRFVQCYSLGDLRRCYARMRDDYGFFPCSFSTLES